MPRRGNTCTSEDIDAGPAKRRRTSTDSESDFPASSQAANFLDTIAKEASTGIIEKISVKNFMCHNRLDISFGAHVNFVIGRNGSGKSAILSALVLGLGGKAVVTSRGNTVKGFIKTGKQSCEIEIRLRNRGTDAYKLDEYGEVIAINRRFTADGSSTYKLKSKAAEKKAGIMKRPPTGGGPPPTEPTTAERMFLDMSGTAPSVVGLEGGIESGGIDPMDSVFEAELSVCPPELEVHEAEPELRSASTAQETWCNHPHSLSQPQQLSVWPQPQVERIRKKKVFKDSDLCDPLYQEVLRLEMRRTEAELLLAETKPRNEEKEHQLRMAYLQKQLERL